MANNKKKKILFVTTSRSDFATLRKLLVAMRTDRELQPFLFVTGDHMARDAGETYKDILAQGLSIDARYVIKSSNPATQIAEVITATTKLLSKHDIAYALVCGDRKEMFAAATACALAGIPLFHIHGGDVTYGMVDDGLRHSITKLSSVHFPATTLSAKRIRQMGEESWRIAMTGSPDVDGLRAKLPEQTTLYKFGLQKKAYAVLLLNPETLLDGKGNAALARVILEALAVAYRGKVIVIEPNNDPSAKNIREAYRHLPSSTYTKVAGLPRDEYLALLKHASFLIGNSSSGITEAATYKVPVINVGHRQDGRERGKNVVDATATTQRVRLAIQKVQTPAFIRTLTKLRNVYGEGDATLRIYRAIHKIIQTRDTRELLYKRFTLL